MDELYAQVRELYYFLQQTDNEKIRIATELLGDFYSHPCSIQILVDMFQKSNDDPIIRQHVTVGLLKAIKRNWDGFDFDSKLNIFKELLNLILSEKVFLIRNNLIDIVQPSVCSEFVPFLFQFLIQITETSSDFYLEIALSLLPLIVGKSEEINIFCIRLLDKGHRTDSIDVKIAALNLALYYPPFIQYKEFSDNLDFYFFKAIQLLHEAFYNIDYLNRLKKLFNFLVSADLGCNIQYLSNVLHECLSFFGKIETKNLDSYMVIFEIVQTFCNTLANYILEWGYFEQIIRISFNLCSLIFKTNDYVDLSNAGFFASIISDLCKTADLVDKLYDFFDEICESEPGRFFILCCLDITLPIFPDYFIGKIVSITEFLYIDLTCSSRLIRDSAIITTNSFIKYYGNKNEYVTKLIYGIYISINSYCNPDILFVLSLLFDHVNNTDDYFDVFFHFLINIIKDSSLENKLAALLCLASLAYSANEQIRIHFNEFFQIISEILYSQKITNSELKANAVICFFKASKNLGECIESYILDFCNFCIFTINNSDDSYLINTCFNALEVIIPKYPKTIYPIKENILSLACEYASIDFDSEYRAYIAKSIDSLGKDLHETIMYDDIDSIPIIVQISFSLKILSLLVKDNIDELIHTYTIHIIKFCELHMNSVSNLCKSAVAYAIGNLSQALVNHHYGSFSTIPDQMGNIILQLLKGNLNDESNFGLFSDAFNAAAKIVEWLDHDSLTTSIIPLLQFSYNFLLNFIKNPIKMNTIDVIYNICSFLVMITMSAEEKSIEILRDFLPIFIKFIEAPSKYLNSIATRFFSSLIVGSYDKLDKDFIINIFNFAFKLANEDNECFSFTYIRELIIKDKNICSNYFNDIYSLCISKIKLPNTKERDFMLMRENCVITLVVFLMTVGIESFDLNEFLPLILNTLPLRDESNNYIVSDFFHFLDTKYNIKVSQTADD